MAENDPASSRREYLHSLSGAVLGTAAFAGGAGASDPETDRGRRGDIEYEQVRGSARNPVSTRRIESLQQEFTERGRDRTGTSVAVLDVESTFADQQVVAYNVILGADDKPREQFVTVGSAETGDDSRGPGTGQQRNRKADTRKHHQKADDMLERAVDEMAGTAGTDDVSATASWDIDWYEWVRTGSTDIYWEPDEKWSYGAKVGNVGFTHEVRRSTEYDRIGARSKIRMEPGRQLCNDGLDDYCTYSIQDGFSNKEATVHHDWDQWVNETPQNDLIVSTDPEGQISDVTSTRGYSLGLDIAREPSLSVGFSSSVSFPGAALIDKTSLTTGRSEHALEMNSADSPSASNTAVFEVGSVAEYEKRCTTSPPLYQRELLEIDVDLEWGLNAPLIDWGHTESTTRSFQYTTYC